jgi:DNA-binding transcriptional regulator YdaS (Cro superfamily)
MISEIIDYFGSVSRLAEALGVSQPAVSQWITKGVPPGRAIQIELMTCGRFKAREIVKLNDDRGTIDE